MGDVGRPEPGDAPQPRATAQGVARHRADDPLNRDAEEQASDAPPRPDAGEHGAGGRLRGVTWGLVVAVLGSWCLAAAAVVAGVAPAHAPATRPLPTATDPQVVVVGIPGLTWDLVDDDTPTLQALARTGGTAALVARGPDEVTCAPDAWLTLGTGTRTDRDALGCGPDATPPWGREDATEPDLGALTGPLEEAGGCVATYGLTAAPDASGRPQLDTEAAGLLAGPALDPACTVHLVAAPAVLEGDRSDVLEAADAALAELVADLPPGSTLVVSGMGQTAGRAEAQALVVHGPTGQESAAPAQLTSGSTRQTGLVQLLDLTPTVLSLAGVAGGAGSTADLPGSPVTVVRTSAAAPAQESADLAAAVSEAKRLAPWTLGALAAVLLPLLGLAGLLGSRRLLVGTTATVMAVPVATFLAGLVPWWRAGQPWPALTVTVLAVAAVVAALAVALTHRVDPSAVGRRRRSLLLPAVLAAATMVVLGVDTLWSSRLGLVGVLGLQPVTAGRFYGQGNVGFGILLGALVVLLAAVLSWLPRWSATLAVALLGGGTLLLGAAPGAGADFGSVPATAVVSGMLLLAALRVRWTWRSLLLVAGGAVVLALLAMVLDWLRGPDRRTHLGAFVQSALDGEAWGVVARKLDQSLGILVGYPLSWLAVLALAGLAWVALRRPAWSAPLWREPGVGPAAAAALVGMTLAWLLNDSGIAALALCLTMLLATGIIVLAPEGEVEAR
ncbi:hypothetical protein [Serinicoccus sediminis]|uniref:hypothetical protein n=1 Tax=Serinicoccus sediminis TaxID=2306021 RepID=UPI00101FB50F|nr:hypothetical protein [Serinicoccus sediminis]